MVLTQKNSLQLNPTHMFWETFLRPDVENIVKFLWIDKNWVNEANMEIWKYGVRHYLINLLNESLDNYSLMKINLVHKQ